MKISVHWTWHAMIFFGCVAIVKLVVLLLIHCRYLECLLNNAGVNILLANLHDCQLNMKDFFFVLNSISILHSIQVTIAVIYIDWIMTDYIQSIHR